MRPSGQWSNAKVEPDQGPLSHAFGDGSLAAEVEPDRLKNRKDFQFSILANTVNLFRPFKMGLVVVNFCLSLVL